MRQCHYVPAWANIAACQLCRDRQPLWNRHDGVCTNAMVFSMVFVLWQKLLPRLTQNNCCTVYRSTVRHEFTSVFSTTLIYAGLPRKASLWNRLLQASVFFCCCASNSQDSSKARAQGRRQDILYVYCFMHTISATDLPISEHQGLCPLKKQPCFWTTGKRNTVWNH